MFPNNRFPQVGGAYGFSTGSYPNAAFVVPPGLRSNVPQLPTINSNSFFDFLNAYAPTSSPPVSGGPFGPFQSFRKTAAATAASGNMFMGLGYLPQTMSRPHSMGGPLNEAASSSVPFYSHSPPTYVVPQASENVSKKRVAVSPEEKPTKCAAPAKKRVRTDSLGEESDYSASSAQASDKSINSPGGRVVLDGENRLAITFTQLGSAGVFPQVYGDMKLYIPDGLRASYTTFGQRWLIAIDHSPEPVMCEDGKARSLIVWTMSNERIGTKHIVTETPRDAARRSKGGRTLCNRVFRETVVKTRKDIEAMLTTETDSFFIKTLQAQIKSISTRRFSEGPLFFGLRHAKVQRAMRTSATRTVSAASASATPFSESHGSSSDDVIEHIRSSPAAAEVIRATPPGRASSSDSEDYNDEHSEDASEW